MTEKISIWAPLKSRVFLAIWIASLATNFGMQIHTMAASWLMVRLDSSPFMVAMVQVSASLPFILFSLLAGTLSDIYDKRRQMLLAQLFALIASALLAFLTYTDQITPASLLFFIAMIGLGTAFYAPAWASSVNLIVPRQHITEAISLNITNFNLARCLSPALGGILITSIGLAWAFILNTLSYIGIVLVLLRCKIQQPKVKEVSSEPLMWAMRMGLGYAWRTDYIRVVLIRILLCGIGGAVFWTLMPVIATHLLEGDATTYATILSAFGLGSVFGSFLITKLRVKIGTQRAALLSQLVLAVTSLGVGFSDSLILTSLLLLVVGGAWMAFMTLMNASIQLSSPEWIVGRMLAIYHVTIFLSLALGGLLWGRIAAELSVDVALFAAGVMTLISLFYGKFKPLHDLGVINVENADLSHPMSDKTRVDPGNLPIVATVMYQVEAENETDFLKAMAELKMVRLRLGAVDWSLQQGLDESDLWVERYISRDWQDHQRRPGRYTHHDNEIRLRVAAFDKRKQPELIRSVQREPSAGMVKQVKPFNNGLI